MNDKRKGLLFQTKKQMNNGAIATGLGFVLYLALLAMGLELPADLVAVAFGVVGIFNSLSVLEGRRKDKENISYNLLWGQLALTIFLVACAVLAVKQRLGLKKEKRRESIGFPPLFSYSETVSSSKVRGTSTGAGAPSGSSWRLTFFMAHRKQITWTPKVIAQLMG